MRGVHTTTLSSCQECGLQLKTEQSLKRHVQFVHEEQRNPENTPCTDCGKLFRSSRMLNVHRRIHHMGPRVHCENCGLEFGSKQLLKYHKKNAHAPMDISPCVECDKVFQSRNLLYHHVRGVHTPAQCQLCDAVFTNHRKLSYHKRKVHRYSTPDGEDVGMSISK